MINDVNFFAGSVSTCSNMSPLVFGRALLIGCNYPESELQVNGCVESMERVQDRLLRNEDVAWSVKMLRDDGADDDAYPTTSRIIHEILALAAWTRGAEGRVCLVWFNGHGIGNGDTDNLVVPCDYEVLGYSLGVDMLLWLLQTFAFDSTLLIVLDCCHPCTLQDILASAHDCEIKADVRIVSRAGVDDLRDPRRDYLTSALLDTPLNSRPVKEAVAAVHTHMMGQGCTHQIPRFMASKREVIEATFFPSFLW